ncbi:NAD-dependent epimerase/dehydratase family protein [Arthrobacter crusticola]|uniref:NAD-dependent epimerase/dehydratase family protein n=1 Tax=Arthrobacter crusticola TaxID=2547960 RepID=A0A4R5U2W4_9MICC|nr:SDR family oxidoreductase [Arthrobacter crusticola]TDK27995.1 NAD-dependent epimerase/dehydratase family protein [Arthrobacter crusticola]
MNSNRQALVFGAAGFIGRWLVKELLDQGIPTTAAVRTVARFEPLRDWLAAHGADVGLLGVVEADLAADGIGLNSDTFVHLSEIYNVAGAYAFGMGADEARAANVDTSRSVVEFAAAVPGDVRLIHLSGYRVGGQEAASVPWSEQKRRHEYKRLGAYEASKVESDAVVQAAAQKLDVALTTANPASVIGHSVTGESDQILGLATTVRDLIAGRLPAIPGGSRTFVPVVTVDYLARFLTLLPVDEETRGKSYWILDDETPVLPELLQLIGRHHGVRVPRLRIPVGIVKRLPRAITHADPETLSFLSPDRYPTGPAKRLAEQHGLAQPDITAALTRWSDYLVATRFGQASVTSAPRGT